jgi:phosphoribosylanthranilate isomerase
MWVKICGNTNLEDAVHAAHAGADAVGFVFAASKRRVAAAQVAAITPHLPAAVERIGVFDTHDGDDIADTALAAGLTAVQLHGGLDVALLEKLVVRLEGVRIIQTLHWSVDLVASKVCADLLSRELERVASMGMVDRVLVDSRVGTERGGTGIAYDWSAARAVFAAAPGNVALIAAGGLKPGNVVLAIEELRPWGVDVASGVEASPGRKDPALVEAFIKNARG